MPSAEISLPFSDWPEMFTKLAFTDNNSQVAMHCCWFSVWFSNFSNVWYYRMGHILLRLFNFNPSMDKVTVWDEITYPFPNIKGATVEVWNG